MGSARYKREHTKKGLCQDCQRPAVWGKLFCEVHLERRRKSAEKSNPIQRDKYISEGRCPKCSIKLEEDEKKYCLKCGNERRKDATNRIYA